MGDVAILDCGAQYAKVIDRRVRELGVRSDIVPVDAPSDVLRRYKAFIISGGPSSVYEHGAPQPDPALFTLGRPILGICYGMQLIAQAFHGEVGQRPTKEYGETHINVESSAPLFAGLEQRQQVLMSHGDSVNVPPKGFEVIAMSEDIIAGIARDDIVGVQFHPEVDLTVHGKDILRNFLFSIAKLEPTHTLDAGIEEAIAQIRATVKEDNVAVLISGGVDSAVSAALCAKALRPEQVYAIHVDHGFMRKDESRQVMEALRAIGMRQLTLVEAQERFASATTMIDGKGSERLCEACDPEVKRQIIGDTFMHIADEQLAKIPGKVYLAQGTLRPDLIESASSLVTTKADKIKTHHNDSSLVRQKREQGLIIETNKDWHKDEVRKIATTLGLPESIAQRQPFPGPGLAVRTLCAREPAVVGAEVERHVREFAPDAHVLPVRSVGVQGDGRTYAHPVVLTAARSWEQAKELASLIPKKVHKVNRVCQLIGGELPDRHVRTLLTPDALDLLREADAIARSVELPFAQMPVILLPVGNEKGRAIVLRPFVTNDFMTGRAAVIGTEFPIETLEHMARRLLALEGVGAVLYDLTSKPPGTTEWE